MGKLVAGGRELSLKDLYARYQDIFLEALRLKTTNKKHTNVLMHMLGYFKGQLSADEKQEMLELIELIRDTVARQKGVTLETEIVIIGDGR